MNLLKLSKWIVQTVKLYERCLIACANYPDYWIRFVQRMDADGKLELALNGLQRSTGIFVKVGNFVFALFLHLRLIIWYGEGTNSYSSTSFVMLTTQRAFVSTQRRPEIHLFAARFREKHGDADGARVAFEILRNELVPGLLEVFVKQANFEHRQVALYTQK